MKHATLNNLPFAILLSSMIGCQGCRDNTSFTFKPEEEPATSSPKNEQEEETFPEKEDVTNSDNEGNAETTEVDSLESPKGTEQVGNSRSGMSSVTEMPRSGTDQSAPQSGIPSPNASELNNTGSGSVASQPKLPTAKFSTPGSALSYAKIQRSKSSEFSKSGDVNKAYQEALEGWQALQPHLANKECEELSRSLLNDLNSYGEQLGASSIRTIGKRLTIK